MTARKKFYRKTINVTKYLQQNKKSFSRSTDIRVISKR